METKIDWKETEAPIFNHGGRNPSVADDELLVRITKKGGPTKGYRYTAISVSIPAKLMELSGMKIGDHVKFVESGGLVALLKSSTGHKIGRLSRRKDEKSSSGIVVRRITPLLQATWGLEKSEQRTGKAIVGEGYIAIPRV